MRNSCHLIKNKESKMKANKFSLVASVFLWMLSSGLSVHAAPPPEDKEALTGLTDVKVIFDITTGDAKKLLSRLGLIEETRDGIVKQGVKPHFILAFRGPASNFVQKDESRIKLEDLEVVAKIQQKIKAMSKDKSYRMAQCAVANRYLKIKNEDTIPELEVVGNSFISIAAYQNKGYAYIPID
jgi:intracellular sulfur oxidation DsrE/DsrF family protein